MAGALADSSTGAPSNTVTAGSGHGIAGRLAWLLCAVTVALAITTVGLHVANRDTPTPPFDSWWAASSAIAALLAVPAAVIATRQPANIVGWMLAALATLESASARDRRVRHVCRRHTSR